MDGKLIKSLRSVVLVFATLAMAFRYAYSFEIESVELLEVSTSGRSVLLNRGESEGLKNGTVAKFFLQSGTPSAPKLIPVAFGRLIKVGETKSYWLLNQIQHGVALKSGQRLVFVEKNEDVLPGRSELEIAQKQVVTSGGIHPLKYFEDEKRGISKELVFKEGESEIVEENERTKLSEGTHLNATQFDQWASSKGLDYVEEYMTEVSKKNIDNPQSRIETAQITKAYNENLTRSQADGTANKINSLKDGLRDLYWKQERDENLTFLPKRVIVNNIYQDSLEKRNAKRSQAISPEAVAKARREGPRWSSDMTDKELREYVVRTGISEEVVRQRAAVNELDSHEMTIHFATSLMDHTSQDDANHRGRTYAFALGYEYHLSRLFKNWLKLSLEANVEWSRGLYQVGPLHNATFQEGAYKLMTNYYIYNKPTTVKNILVYLGTGIKVGQAKAGNFEFTEKHRYDMIAFPMFQLGLKYRFLSGDEVDNAVGVGFGLNTKLSIEPLSYTLDGQATEQVEGSFSLTDTKLFVGMSMYF